MDKVLIITNSADINWNKVFHKQKIDDQYFFHTINTSTESVIRFIKNHTQYNNYQLCGIDTTKIHQLAEDESREYYLKLFRDLPKKKLFKGRSISDLLTINDRNYWWYLPISEKNIWLDKSIHRFFEIKRLKNTLNNDEYDKIICCIDDGILQASFQQMSIQKKTSFKAIHNKHTQFHFAVLKFCFTYFINVSKAIISLYIKKIFVLKTTKQHEITDGEIGFFSFFPFFWQDMESDHPNDIFFKNIPDKIAKTNQVVHLIWLSPWRKLLFSQNLLKGIIKKKNICTLENKLKFRDALSLYSLTMFMRLLKILSDKRKIQLGEIDGVNIDNIVYDEFYRSFSSPALFQSLLIDKALQKLQLRKSRMLFFRLEFQPHERAILYNTRGKVKSVGFQHSALSKNFLNYVFMKDELGTYWKNRNDSSSMPLPDHIFTSGNIGSNFMTNAGYPNDQLFICGGIRYDDLRKNNHLMPSKKKLRDQYKIPNNNKIIFVTTTPIVYETVSMFNVLYHAIKDMKLNNENYLIIIKHHPNTQSMKDYKIETDEIITLLRKIVSLKIVWNSIDLHKFIKMSDVILTTGGTIPLEAMILGRPSIIFSSNLNFSHNPLQNYPHSALFVNDILSMTSALNQVVHDKLNTQLKENWIKPINDMFGNYPNINFNQAMRDLFDSNNK